MSRIGLALASIALVLALGTMVGQEPTADDVKTLLRAARLATQAGNYAGALSRYERLVPLAEKVYGGDSAEVGAMLGELGEAYFRNRRHKEAETAMLRCLKIREARHGADHLLTAYSRNTLGTIYVEMGRNEEAENLLKPALAVYEREFGPEHLNIAPMLNNLGMLLSRTGQLAEAEKLLKRSLQIKEKTAGPDHATTATGLHNLAKIYVEMRRFKEAEALYERSLKIHEKVFGPEHPETAIALTEQAELYVQMGLLGKATNLYQRALRICARVYGPDSMEYATELNRIGLLYEKIGLHDQAIACLTQALQLIEKVHGPDHLAAAGCLQNLGEIYRAQRDFARARPSFERSLKIKEAKAGPNSEDTALTLNSLGALFREHNDLKNAEPYLKRALAITEKNLGADHPETAFRVNSLGVLAHSMGDFARAEELHRRALNIFETKLPHDFQRISDSSHNLAELFAAQERWPEAIALSDRGRKLTSSHVRRVLSTLDEAEQLFFLAYQDRLSHCSALSIALRSGSEEGAARSAEWNANAKALSQEALSQRARAERAPEDAQSARTARALLDVRQRIAALTYAPYEADREEQRRNGLNQLLLRERALASELTRLTREDASAEIWVSLDQLRGAIPDEAVFIDFICFPVMNFRPTGQASQWEPVRCAAWIIPPAGNGKVVLVDLGDLDIIEQAIARALEVLRDGPSARSEVEGMKTAQAALQRMSKLILEPLLPHIGGTRRWIVSPDSQLWLIPWNALLLPNGEYVIEKHTVTHVVSARDLLRPAQEGSNQPALALADPDYDLDLRDAPREEAGARAPISRGMLNARWPRLPGTAREISGIAPKLQTLTGRSPTLLTGEKALETAVKKTRRPRILVLSTHGFFLGSQAPASGQELASVERGLRLEKPTTSRPAAAEEPLENPLLRCGLILAGANRRSEIETTDDGVLTGLEIVGADLRGTELVVLSACETGLGTLRQGEGVAGLRQAFHLAGAESVVATLWKVPDEETAQLMTSFFEHLASGKTRADALRLAQLTLIQSRRRQHGVAHPYWWAAFTLTDSTSR